LQLGEAMKKKKTSSKLRELDPRALRQVVGGDGDEPSPLPGGPQTPSSDDPPPGSPGNKGSIV
jgi:hypothetical protein